MTSYDPTKSLISEDKLGDFLRTALTGELEEVPGIALAAKKALAQQNITSTWQLIGKFLSLKGTRANGKICGPCEHVEEFWNFLRDSDVNSHRATIVRCIAEKANLFLPGIYDNDIYMEDHENLSDLLHTEPEALKETEAPKETEAHNKKEATDVSKKRGNGFLIYAILIAIIAYFAYSFLL